VVALVLATFDMLVHTRDAWTSLVPCAMHTMLEQPQDAATTVFEKLKNMAPRPVAQDGKIVARKDGTRTLVDVESLKAYYASLPVKQ
jgi:hypothetical protein